MTGSTRKTIRPWMLILPAGVLVGLFVTAAVLQHAPPPGVEIMGQELPDRHPEGPCFECHRGMARAAELRGRELPEAHPPDRCAECHEGYVAPTPTPADAP
ncbi:MAG: hypothetical protein FJX74_07420 [Armatimonadetes bacterium]|nr:hypothetical protein [Armatimonadota bacterium]